MNRHCKAARQHIDSATKNYKRAAEEIEKAIYEDDLTYREVAEQIGKSRNYVDKLLKALSRSRDTGMEFEVDWESGTNKRSELVPSRFVDQVRMANEVLARPNVAETVVRNRTPASRAVERAVSQKRHEENRELIRAAEQHRHAGALPISGHIARITGKVQMWADELASIEPDLVEARDGFMSPALARALQHLGETCLRIAGRIELDDTQDMDVIELR